MKNRVIIVLLIIIIFLSGFYLYNKSKYHNSYNKFPEYTMIANYLKSIENSGFFYVTTDVSYKSSECINNECILQNGENILNLMNKLDIDSIIYYNDNNIEFRFKKSIDNYNHASYFYKIDGYDDFKENDFIIIPRIGTGYVEKIINNHWAIISFSD